MAKFYYGGQAVIEGVMMRGQRHMAVAVRAPDGRIVVHEEPLKGALYRHPALKITPHRHEPDLLGRCFHSWAGGYQR